MKNTLLIIDNDPLLLRAATRVFRGMGWSVKPVLISKGTDDQARAAIKVPHDVILCDWDLGRGIKALDVTSLSDKPVVIWSGRPETIDASVRARYACYEKGMLGSFECINHRLLQLMGHGCLVAV